MGAFNGLTTGFQPIEIGPWLRSLLRLVEPVELAGQGTVCGSY